MTRLSVNVNKVALLRNARGTNTPDIIDFVNMAIDAGADGITVHPRQDERHIRLDDVRQIGRQPVIASNQVELNIEGDPRPELLDFVTNHAHYHQFTLVPVTPGEITSSRGWSSADDANDLRRVVATIRQSTTLRRVSMFANPTVESVQCCVVAGADAVEFYTGDYALRPHDRPNILSQIRDAAAYARDNGLRIHAGHDLDLTNLPDLLTALQPDEVSMGHALICDALRDGFSNTIRRYVDMVKRDDFQ